MVTILWRCDVREREELVNELKGEKRTTKLQLGSDESEE